MSTIDDKLIKQAEDACRPSALHEIGKIAKDTVISAAVGAGAGTLIAPGPGTVIGGIGGAIGGFGYSLNGVGSPDEHCVAEHIAGAALAPRGKGIGGEIKSADTFLTNHGVGGVVSEIMHVTSHDHTPLKTPVQESPQTIKHK